MKWFLRSLAVLAVLWSIFVLSPYASLYKLARAVEENDEAALRERVDFPGLRASVARQLAVAAAEEKGQRSALGQTGVAAAGKLLEPVLDPYVRPQAIIALLKGHQLQPGAEITAAAESRGPSVLSLYSVQRVGELLSASEWSGFRKFALGVPPGSHSAERYRLVFQIQPNLTWQLAAVVLPDSVRAKLVRELRGRLTG